MRVCVCVCVCEDGMERTKNNEERRKRGSRVIGGCTSRRRCLIIGFLACLEQANQSISNIHPTGYSLPPHHLSLSLSLPLSFSISLSLSLALFLLFFPASPLSLKLPSQHPMYRQTKRRKKGKECSSTIHSVNDS